MTGGSVQRTGGLLTRGAEEADLAGRLAKAQQALAQGEGQLRAARQQVRQASEALEAKQAAGPPQDTTLIQQAQAQEESLRARRAELAALRQCCDVQGLFLYLDGARMGSALTSPDNDLTLPELAALTHAFTIGGTKNGALFGEALVLTRPMPHFRWHMKQRGAVLAKGRLLGLQFQALLEDGLYFDLARRANELAFRLRDGVAALGYPFPVASPSNQQFPVLPNETVAKLQEMGYEFETDHPVDANHTCIRLVTSWATPETAVEDFLRDLAGC